MLTRFRSVVMAFVVVIMLLESAGAVFAAKPTKITVCPFTITAPGHYLLLNNCLVGSGEIAITVTANNVDLTMAGHTLTGPSDGTGTGILVIGASGVSITGGTVTGFKNGVELDSVSGSRVNGLTAANNIAAAPDGNGFWLHGSSSNVLAGDTSSGNRTGFRIENESNDNTLSADIASANLGNGLVVRADASHSISGNVLVSNLATGNTNGISLGGNGTGGVTNTTVQGNNTSANSSGIMLSKVASDNLVSTNISNNNVVVNMTGGNSIFVAGPSNTLINNITNGNAGTGIGITPSATGTTVTGNTTSFNGFYGIDVSSTGNSIQSNTANTDHFNGIILRAGATGNTLQSNTALSAVVGADLFDDNPQPALGVCPNTWVGDTFDTGSVGGAGASCIH